MSGSNSSFQIRRMTGADVQSAHVIRLRVRENRLSDPSVVVEEDYHDFMARDTMSWVCEVDGVVAGFAMVDVEKSNLWALFVAPELEFKGIGRALHNTLCEWYFKRNHVLRLSTDPGTRADAFYRKAGYTPLDLTATGERIFELKG